MKLKLSLLFLVLLVFPLANALTISNPLPNDVNYNNIVKFNVIWTDSLATCKYQLNNQSNQTFSCDTSFYLDIPYNNGQANITLFGINDTSQVETTTINLNINDPITPTNGLIGFAVLLFSMFLPLFLLLVSWCLKFVEDQQGSMITIRYCFIFLAIMFMFIPFNVANILVRQYIHLDILSDVITPYPSWTYGVVILFTFITFIIIIYQSFMFFSNRKKRTGDYDE